MSVFDILHQAYFPHQFHIRTLELKAMSISRYGEPESRLVVGWASSQQIIYCLLIIPAIMARK